MPPEKQFEEASLSNPEGRDIFSGHSGFNIYFGKLFIIRQIGFLLNRNLPGDNNMLGHMERRNGGFNSHPVIPFLEQQEFFFFLTQIMAECYGGTQ